MLPEPTIAEIDAAISTKHPENFNGYIELHNGSIEYGFFRRHKHSGLWQRQILDTRLIWLTVSCELWPALDRAKVRAHLAVIKQMGQLVLAIPEVEALITRAQQEFPPEEVGNAVSKIYWTGAQMGLASLSKLLKTL